MSGLGFTKKEEELIRGVLQRHPEIVEAKIFGSRAKGSFGPNSDVDMALWGRLSKPLLATIAGELAALPLPYLFALQDYAAILHEPLRDHIDRVGKLFYAQPRNEPAS